MIADDRELASTCDVTNYLADSELPLQIDVYYHQLSAYSSKADV